MKSGTQNAWNNWPTINWGTGEFKGCGTYSLDFYGDQAEVEFSNYKPESNPDGYGPISLDKDRYTVEVRVGGTIIIWLGVHPPSLNMCALFLQGPVGEVSVSRWHDEWLTGVMTPKVV